VIVVITAKEKNFENSSENSPKEAFIVVVVIIRMIPLFFLFSGFLFKIVEFSGISWLTGNKQYTEDAHENS